MSDDNKKMMNELFKSEELKESKRAFGMTYEEFLELYEQINGFEDENYDKAIDSLGIIQENDVKEQPKIMRRRYKITGKK